jgi:FkbM family methyltransferase
MLRTLKTSIRDALPRRYQVPLKFWYSKLRGDLEDEMALLPKLFFNPSDRVIDIGANRGVYAYALARPGAKVELFEPNSACAQILASWAARKPNVSLHAVALSDHEGSAELQIPVDVTGVEHDASASIEKSGSGKFREQVVPLATLDSFKFRQVALIKIDVEGHEFRVIEGAQKTIASDTPALLIEIEQRHNSRPITAVFKRVTDCGYEGFFMCQGNLRPLPEFDVSAHQIPENLGGRSGAYINNFLFLHHSRLAKGEYDRLPGLVRLK